MNYEGVCKTAPATPGLLIRVNKDQYIVKKAQLLISKERSETYGEKMLDGLKWGRLQRLSDLFSRRFSDL